MAMRLEAHAPAKSPQIADAAKASHADGVGLSLSWNAIEPNPPAPDGTHTYAWDDSSFDKMVNALRDAKVKLLTVRISDPPEWAVKGKVCKYKACPPTRGHYDDFRDFVKAAVSRYGPGGTGKADVRHWSLWNEPNKKKEWGGEDAADGSYKEYSDLLVPFHAAVKSADQGQAGDRTKVDAGELAAGGGHGANRPRGWTVDFNRYNKARGRNDIYDLVTIHAYSATPHDVVDKINNYEKVFTAHHVAITEFGWSVGRGSGPSRWKCVSSEPAQAAKLEHTVKEVRRAGRLEYVPWLVWFNGIDNKLDRGRGAPEPKCETTTGYQESVGPYMNTFGLYRRDPSGSMATLPPRPVRDAFLKAADHTPAE